MLQKVNISILLIRHTYLIVEVVVWVGHLCWCSCSTEV